MCFAFMLQVDQINSFNFQQLHCHNFFFPSFSVASLPQFLLNFFSFLPYNFGNLVATIAFFLSSTSLLQALHLGSCNFSNLINEIQIFSHSSHHIISLSFLILFVRIFRKGVTEICFFLHFSK